VRVSIISMFVFSLFEGARLNSLVQLAIRLHAMKLMKQENKKSPFNAGPSNWELQQFNPDIGHCCTVDNFQVDIRNHLQSSWNISAGKVFVADFIAKYSDAKIDDIEKIFSKHLGYLMKDYMCYGTKSPER